MLDPYIDFFVQSFNDVSFQLPTLGVLFAIFLVMLLMGASAFASGSEIAFFSLSPSDLSEISDQRTSSDKKIQALREDSERTLATILITNNFVNVTIIMLCNYIFAHIMNFGPRAYWLQFLSLTVLLTFLLLLFGEIMPKVSDLSGPEISRTSRVCLRVLFALVTKQQRRL